MVGDVRRTSRQNVRGRERVYGSGVSQAGPPYPRFDRSGQVGSAGPFAHEEKWDFGPHP